MACLWGSPPARCRGALPMSYAVKHFRWAVNATQPALQHSTFLICRSTHDSVMESRTEGVRQLPEERR